jgi:hypothetical protein
MRRRTEHQPPSRHQDLDPSGPGPALPGNCPLSGGETAINGGQVASGEANELGGMGLPPVHVGTYPNRLTPRIALVMASSKRGRLMGFEIYPSIPASIQSSRSPLIA